MELGVQPVSTNEAREKARDGAEEYRQGLYQLQ